VTPFDGDNEAGVQAFNSANTTPLPPPWPRATPSDWPEVVMRARRRPPVSPPASMVYLTIIARTKQKAANW